MGLFRRDERECLEKLSHIRMLLFDVDGVLTNGDLIFGPNGTEYKIFSVQDGLGFSLAKQAGLKTGIITSRKSAAVAQRANELKLDAFFQGDNNKLFAFERTLNQFGLAAEEVCYMGDDLLDLVLLQRAGFSAAPANARPEVLAKVDYITLAKGGDGAARELIELVLKTHGRWEQILKDFFST